MSLKEIRCGNCRRLLAKGEASDLTIKCPRCGAINHVRTTSSKPEGHRASTQETLCGQNKTVSSPGTMLV